MRGVLPDLPDSLIAERERLGLVTVAFPAGSWRT
jgi:hypothetical protein